MWGVAIATTKLEDRSAKLSLNESTNFSVSHTDCPESQNSSNLKRRRDPVWVRENGLTLLFEPATPTATIADVVFVHGLQGHPYKTWLHKGKVERKIYDEVGAFCYSLFRRFYRVLPISLLSAS